VASGFLRQGQRACRDHITQVPLMCVHGRIRALLSTSSAAVAVSSCVRSMLEAFARNYAIAEVTNVLMVACKHRQRSGLTGRPASYRDPALTRRRRRPPRILHTSRLGHRCTPSHCLHHEHSCSSWRRASRYTENVAVWSRQKPPFRALAGDRGAALPGRCRSSGYV
jgi:hypothetical protein